jgi:hypothetical protein
MCYKEQNTEIIAKTLPHTKYRLGMLALWPWQLWRRRTLIVFPLRNLIFVLAQRNGIKMELLVWCPNPKYVNTKQRLCFNMFEILFFAAIIGGWYIHIRGVLNMKKNYIVNVTQLS